MPPPAPVTIATLPSSSPGMKASLGRALYNTSDDVGTEKSAAPPVGAGLAAHRKCSLRHLIGRGIDGTPPASSGALRRRRLRARLERAGTGARRGRRAAPRPRRDGGAALPRHP